MYYLHKYFFNLKVKRRLNYDIWKYAYLRSGWLLDKCLVTLTAKPEVIESIIVRDE